MHLVNVSHIHAFLSLLFSFSSFTKYFLPYFSMDVHVLLLYVTSKNKAFVLFCGKSCWMTLASVGIHPLKEPEQMRGLLNCSFKCFMEAQQNSTCTYLLLFLLRWLCRYILNIALCVYLSRAFSVLCHVFTFVLAVDHMHASFALSPFFLAILQLGHLPPLSHRRSFCFVRTQWPSGSGIRDHPLLHGLLKNPSLSAAWYVLVFLVESCFWDVLSVRNCCLHCSSNLSLSRRVWARPCSAWKCGYNQKSSWKTALGFHASLLANMTPPRLKDKNSGWLHFFFSPHCSSGNSA